MRPVQLPLALILFPAAAGVTLAGAPESPRPAPAKLTDIPFDRAWLGVDGALDIRDLGGKALGYIAPKASMSQFFRVREWDASPSMPARGPEDLAFAETCRDTFPLLAKLTLPHTYYRDGDILWTGRVMDAEAATRTVVVDLKGVDASRGTLVVVLRERLQAPEKKHPEFRDFKKGFQAIADLTQSGLEALYTASKTAPATFTGERSPAPRENPKPVKGTLAEGHLDPSWFGGSQPLAFHGPKGIDYLWVKPGFELKGKRLQIARWEPLPLPEGCTDRDEDRAHEMRVAMPAMIKEVFARDLAGLVSCSDTDGELRAVGRFVSVQERPAFIPSTQEFDFKIVDARSGELLVAVHHNSTRTNIVDAMREWVERMAAITRSGLGAAYDSGPRMTE
ncbi:MAG TPA: hypothetical protein VJ600_03410 [Holophagaceae bacterium]|nr:hypothetical protein [Holophagaceae bacterium]